MEKRLATTLVATLLFALPGIAAPENATPLDAPPASQRQIDAYSRKLRDITLVRWKSPAPERTAIVRVTASATPAGRLEGIQISIEPPLSAQNEKLLRESLQDALTFTFPPPPGLAAVPVEFKLVAQNGPYLASCYPLRLYVSTRYRDSGQDVPATSLSAMTGGISTWNSRITRHSGEKVGAAIVVVDRPEDAEVRLEPYEDMPGIGPYFEDQSTGQQVLRLGLTRSLNSATQVSRRALRTEIITQQTMFQLGRMLGLFPSNDERNMLAASLPRPKAPVSQYSSTKDVQVEYASSFQIRSNGTRNNSPFAGITTAYQSDTAAESGDVEIEERTLAPEQLDEVIKNVTKRTCTR